MENTYQWNGTAWVLLVLLVLGVVEQAFTGLAGPGGNRVGIGLGVLEEIAELVGGDSLIAEPEVNLLRAEQDPIQLLVWLVWSNIGRDTYLGNFWFSGAL